MFFDIIVGQSVQHEKALNRDEPQFISSFDKLRLGTDDSGSFGVFFNKVYTDFSACKTIDQVQVYNSSLSGGNDFIYNICNGTDISI